MLAPLAAAVAIAVCPPAGPVAPVENVDAPAAEALLACVGTSAISGELFGHWRAIAHTSVPETQPDELRRQVMEFLLNAKWLDGEAAERGINVSDRAVRHQLASQRRESFPDKRDFRRFLEESGMTRSDIKYRVRVDILSERIQRDAAGEGSARMRERRLSRFLSRFPEKWKARTSCLAAYANTSCGATLAPPPP